MVAPMSLRPDLHQCCGYIRRTPAPTRLQTEAEALNLQGWPIFDERFKKLLEEESNCMHQDLAGNAFPTTCLTACILALIFAAELKYAEENEVEVSTDSEVKAAMALMQMVET